MQTGDILGCYASRRNALIDNHPDKATRWGNSQVNTPPGVATVNAKIAMPNTADAMNNGNETEILPNLTWATRCRKNPPVYTKASTAFEANGWVVVAPNIPGKYTIGSHNYERNMIENGRDVTILTGPSTPKEVITREFIIAKISNDNNSKSYADQQTHPKVPNPARAVAVVTISDVLHKNGILATYTNESLAGQTFLVRFPFGIREYVRKIPLHPVRDESRNRHTLVHFVHPMAVENPISLYDVDDHSANASMFKIRHKRVVSFIQYVIGFNAKITIQEVYQIFVQIPPLTIAKTIHTSHVTSTGDTITIAVDYKAALAVERTVDLKPGSRRHLVATAIAKTLLKTLTTPNIPPHDEELAKLVAEMPNTKVETTRHNQKTPETSPMQTLLHAVKGEYEARKRQEYPLSTT